MAQLVVRNIEESVKRRLKKRADAHGRSLEGEVREILRAVAAETRPVAKTKREQGFGTRLAEIFAGKVPPEFEIPDFRSEPVHAAKFDE